MPLGLFSRAKLPPEYRNLPDEQIIEILNKNKENETAATEAREKARLAEEKATKLEADITELRKPKPPDHQRVTDQDQNRNQNRNANKEEELGPEHWLTDPVDATRRVMNEQNAPLTAIALHSGMMAAQMQAEQIILGEEGKNGNVNKRLWKKYRADVQKLVEQEPAERRIFPQVWVNAFTYVKGQHLNEVITEAQSAGDAFFSETGASSGASFDRTNDQNTDTLTDEEKTVAKKMGVSEKSYLERKKKMVFGPQI